MKKIISILSMVLILVGCGSNSKEKYTNIFYDTFDTQVQYLEFASSEDEFNKNFNYVKEEFTRLHRLYDNYRKYEGINNVYVINEMAGKEPVKVEDDLFNLIKYSIENYDKTLGKVNIAMGSVLEIWHDIREENEGIEDDTKTLIPDKNELEKANKHVDINQIVLDEKEKTVFIKDPNVQIDLGATAKGYATELVSKRLEEKGVDSASINAGGNVRTIGNKPDNKKWGIAIQNPYQDGQDFLEVLYFNGSNSVVTSGDYQRYFMHNGKRYHHLIDPNTLFPEDLYRSVSIYTKDSGLADILSTAIYLSTEEEAKEILSNYEDEIGVIWADDNGKWMSDNMKDVVKN